jgi:hypothetical protein
MSSSITSGPTSYWLRTSAMNLCCSGGVLGAAGAGLGVAVLILAWFVSAANATASPMISARPPAIDSSTQRSWCRFFGGGGSGGEACQVAARLVRSWFSLPFPLPSLCCLLDAAESSLDYSRGSAGEFAVYRLTAVG